MTENIGMNVCSIQKNHLQVSHQITLTAIIPFVYHLCLKVYKTAAAAGSKIYLKGFGQREIVNPDDAGES